MYYFNILQIQSQTLDIFFQLKNRPNKRCHQKLAYYQQQALISAPSLAHNFIGDSDDLKIFKSNKQHKYPSKSYSFSISPCHFLSLHPPVGG